MKKILLVLCALMLFLTSCLDENGNMQVFDSNGNLVPMPDLPQIETVQKSIDEQATAHPEKPFYMDTYRPNEDGLVLYLPFYRSDFDMDTSTIKSFDNNGYEFISNNTTWSADGRYFGGVNSSIAYSTSVIGSSNQTGTFIVWIYPQSVGSALYTVSGSAGKMFMIRLYNAREVSIRTYDGAYDSIKSNNAISNTTWSMVSVSSNGSSWFITINGIAQELSVIEGANTGEWIADIIGKYRQDIGILYATYYPFLGKMSELWLYDRKLTTSEILQIYNETKWRFE